MESIIEKGHVWPSSKTQEPQSAYLSIIDATAARFPEAGAIWFFANLPEDLKEPTSFAQHLKVSLSDTLNLYPQWTGQLQWAPVRPHGKHVERFKRPMTIWGKVTDPGVEWTVSTHTAIVSDIVPSKSSLTAGTCVWIGDDFSQKDFISSTKLPMDAFNVFDGLCAVQVKLTLFEQGGYAIGIKIAHILADAQSVLNFVHHWAARSRELSGNPLPCPVEAPVFDPALLDSKASGDIDCDKADEELVAISRALPQRRHDWWSTDEPGYPSFMIANAEASKPTDPALLAKAMLSPTHPLPWHTWDVTAPVSFALIHFSGIELNYLRDSAKSGASDGKHVNISRLDAGIAHMWQLINRARVKNGLITKGEIPPDVYLHNSLGLRTRVSPPLPESFLGSLVCVAAIQRSSADFTSTSPMPLGEIATQVRQLTDTFTPAAVGAFLHEQAHEVSPQRVINGFWGLRHTLVTSWLRLSMHDVTFGAGGEHPLYAHPVMPKVDGLLQVMDSDVGDGGMDFALYLEASAAKRVREDHTLRPWFYNGGLKRSNESQ